MPRLSVLKQSISDGLPELAVWKQLASNLRNRMHYPRICALVCLAFAGFSWSGKLVAQVARFERLGPYGGTVRSLMISPKNIKTVYLGTNDGQIFKSADGGVTWNILYPGLNRRQLVIDTIVEDPDSADHLFAGAWDLRSSGGGLFESRDSGRSWTQVNLPTSNVAVRGFAISQGSPSHMIVGTGAGVFVTSDGGNSWRQSGMKIEGFRQTESVAIDPRDPRFLFVGTWHLGYRSVDFGKTWVQNDRGMIFDSDVFSISIDRQNGSTIFASACTGLYRSLDRGSSWTRLRVFPTSYQVRAQVVSIDPANSDKVFAGTTEGLFASLDNGKTWARVTPSDLTINAIQVDPLNDNVVLAGAELYGVLRSEDGGRSWVQSNDGFVSRSIVRVLPDPANPGRILVGELSEGKTGGFYVFDNPVNSWMTPSPAEMPGEGMMSMLTLPGDHGRVVGTANGAFLQSPGSTAWTRLPGPIGDLSIYDLTVDKDGEWVFAGTSDGVYRTSLEELHFQKPSGYTFIPRVFSLLPSSKVSGRIFAGTHVGVLRSDDFGLTWQFASDGIPDHTLIECLVFAPGQERRLFAGTSAGLYESEDGGAHWKCSSDGRMGVEISSIIFLDAQGRRVVAADGVGGGVFLSPDAGAHWEKIESPEFGSPVRSIAQDSRHPTTLYLGTSSEGVYRLFLPASDFGPRTSDPK